MRFKRSYLEFVRFFSELTATGIIVGLGCMGCIEGGRTQIGITFGLVVMVTIQIFGFISGGHANPCVTLCSFLLRELSLDRMVLYIIAQFLGAFLGYGMLTLAVPKEFIFGKAPGLCMTVPNKDTNVTYLQAVLIEFVLTSALIIGWCALWDVRSSKSDSVAQRIGILVACLTIVGGNFTGASMNPARTLAPAIFHKNFEHVWIYFSSQFAAAVIMPFVWKFLFTPQISAVPPVAKVSTTSADSTNNYNCLYS